MKRSIVIAVLMLVGCKHTAGRMLDTASEDRVDSYGHTFVCAAQASNEEDALSAAEAACNDKICRVCGVEVESTFVATETLKGTDVKRTVIEHCKHVRAGGLNIKRKTNDCGEEGCITRINVLFSKADEQIECKSYTDSNFADSTACETDIDAFRKVTGQTSVSMLERRGHLQSALTHCAKIDVRPTPLIMALNQKLLAGMDAFELTKERQDELVNRKRQDNENMRQFLDRVDAEERDRGRVGGQEHATRASQDWSETREQILMRHAEFVDHWLITYEPLRAQFSETKILTDRIRIVLDYVINKQYVLAVTEATGKQLSEPGGINALLVAMKQAPKGEQYGTDNVHFYALEELAMRTTLQKGSRGRVEGDYSSILRWMDATYPNAEEWKRFNFLAQPAPPHDPNASKPATN